MNAHAPFTTTQPQHHTTTTTRQPQVTMSQQPSEEMCAKAPGTFFECSYGRSHYRLLGKPQGKPLVVCLHGISAEGAAYLKLAEELVPLGYQCLLPDLYGRGFTDAPAKHVYNDVHLFTSQVAELLLAVAEETDYQSAKGIYLIGSSMGGAIAAKFAHMHPRLVKKLVLVCPAGLPNDMPFLASLVKVPGLGEALLSMASKKTIADGAARSYADPTREGAKEHLENTLKRGAELAKHHPAHGKALINTVRNFKFGGLTASFEELGRRQELPILLVWGNKDIVVPFHNHETILKLIPHAQFIELDNGGHVDMFAVPHLRQMFHEGVVAHFAGEPIPHTKGDAEAETETAEPSEE
ncbi:hypothetical protein PTSG_08690 [Salpingoeca rosetta]|uniref:AB hydrolase-1 domain-containing protein n=1 Tax=Salpingoeca rosetta (strain ATCC 50818 / BSB-021) TaxID=946362 RepID=F2UKE4_SALR5|nr:uncharacterized protein PTSG_08690 [Salpingoeca rosetta]EGD77593.1 hypothetical protein PTSG_08690 [Salpingoeca rosetta]|eukprot:XP_004990481.1 hypothetical protein PTSG_08690 [Salpingoeca rosetta]